MQEQIKQVASRIRELREIFGASVEELARAFQVSEADYRQYESGTVDIPVGILYQLAQRFGVELTTLLTGEEPRLRTYALTRSGQGVSVDRRQQYGYQSLAYNFIHKRAEPFLVTVDPGPEHFNSHPGQEFHHVLSGTLRVLLDQHELVLGPGDSLYFDSSVAHSLTALNDAPEHINSHPGQEFHYVLEGTLRVRLDQHQVVLGPGDSLYFDSSVPHSLTALDQAPVRVLTVIL